jgi:hypothetical protein
VENLLAEPERYAGKVVAVTGYLSLWEGEQALYVDKDAVRAGRREAVWAELAPHVRSAIWPPGQRLTLVGRFEDGATQYGYRGRIIAEEIEKR